MHPGPVSEVGDTIACANQKGGVGKTTTVVNLAAELALRGRRVLVVDVDPQGNATTGLGADRSTTPSLYEALCGTEAVDALVIGTAVPGLSLIPSSRSLAGLEVELVSLDRRERRLSLALSHLREAYDHILLDCPPSLGLLTVNALTAADAMLIPVQCEYYALEAMSQLIGTIDLVRDHLNPHLGINGVVLTMFDARTRLASDVSAEVRRHLGESVYETVIPRSVRLAEAPSYGAPAAIYAPQSVGAQAYRDLASEFLARDGRYRIHGQHQASSLGARA
ncbi:AAA family ATPase [soil metagenome]